MTSVHFDVFLLEKLHLILWGWFLLAWGAAVTQQEPHALPSSPLWQGYRNDPEIIPTADLMYCGARRAAVTAFHCDVTDKAARSEGSPTPDSVMSPLDQFKVSWRLKLLSKLLWRYTHHKYQKNMNNVMTENGNNLIGNDSTFTTPQLLAYLKSLIGYFCKNTTSWHLMF